MKPFIQQIKEIRTQNKKTQEETNRKVDALSSKEFTEYKENKKLVKQNVISKVTTTIVAIIFGGLTFLFGLYFK